MIISDYQCPDCKRVEGEVRSMLEMRDDVSFSAKHFPMCTQCNRFCEARNFNPHPNACWAARAAEAAGLLQGADGFFRMHHWLFDRQGSFTSAELNAALPELGFDAQEFVQTMTGVLTEQYVKEDIEEGIQLGLHFTPMVFINGVEVKGWTRPGAVREAIEAVAASAPPPGSATDDVPATAAEKYVNDWRDERVRVLPSRDADWARTPAPRGNRMPVEVVIFGDYVESGTKTLDKRHANRATIGLVRIAPQVSERLEVVHGHTGRLATHALKPGQLGYARLAVAEQGDEARVRELELIVSLAARSRVELFFDPVRDDRQDTDRVPGGFAEPCVRLVLEPESEEERRGGRVEARQTIGADPIGVRRLLVEDQSDAVLHELAPALRQANALRAIASLRVDTLDVAVLLRQPGHLAARLPADRQLLGEFGQGPRFAPYERDEGAETRSDARVAALALESVDDAAAELAGDRLQVAHPVVPVALDLCGCGGRHGPHRTPRRSRMQLAFAIMSILVTQGPTTRAGEREA